MSPRWPLVDDMLRAAYGRDRTGRPPPAGIHMHALPLAAAQRAEWQLTGRWKQWAMVDVVTTPTTIRANLLAARWITDLVARCSEWLIVNDFATGLEHLYLVPWMLDALFHEHTPDAFQAAHTLGDNEQPGAYGAIYAYQQTVKKSTLEKARRKGESALYRYNRERAAQGLPQWPEGNRGQ